jgi:cytochrome oxidase Cu insertion factor (SCO1/SenC/PrrC family)
MSTEPERRPARTQLWLLILMFFGPLALAFVLYYGLHDFKPKHTTNRGDLIDPARPLPNSALSDPNGGTLAPQLLRGKWTLLYIGDGQCNPRCHEALTLIRQTRLALGEDMRRVQRVFLVTGNCCDQNYLVSEHEGLILARADDAAAAGLISLFPTYDGTPVAEAGRIYIVDPLGNLMMSYSPSAPTKGLLEDLKKLLKLSHIG